MTYTDDELERMRKSLNISNEPPSFEIFQKLTETAMSKLDILNDKVGVYQKLAEAFTEKIKTCSIQMGLDDSFEELEQKLKISYDMKISFFTKYEPLLHSFNSNFNVWYALSADEEKYARKEEFLSLIESTDRLIKLSDEDIEYMSKGLEELDGKFELFKSIENLHKYLKKLK